MMSLEEMKRLKKKYSITNAMIAERSGVPLATVQKVFSGATPHPRYATLASIDKVIQDYNEYGESFVAEPTYVYGTGAKKDIYSGKTVDDYLALPDDVRVELIDGVFYDMAAPTSVHQHIALSIGATFNNHVNSHGGSCIPFISPIDVKLGDDDKTMVQPDVLIICDRSKITYERIIGTPDMVVEIVSPSNSYMDTIIKLNKYKKSGVREYWIVFPKEKKIFTYFFEESDEPKEYSFDDKVSVRVWNNECEVDFAEIYKKISFMLE